MIDIKKVEKLFDAFLDYFEKEYQNDFYDDLCEIGDVEVIPTSDTSANIIVYAMWKDTWHYDETQNKIFGYYCNKAYWRRYQELKF